MKSIKHNRILYTKDHIVKRKTVIFQIKNNTKKKKEQNRNMLDTTVKHKNIRALLFLSDNVFVFVICPEYLLIMTTENIYIWTVRKSRHNNHKVMYSEKVFYFFTKFLT